MAVVLHSWIVAARYCINTCNTNGIANAAKPCVSLLTCNLQPGNVSRASEEFQPLQQPRCSSPCRAMLGPLIQRFEPWHGCSWLQNVVRHLTDRKWHLHSHCENPSRPAPVSPRAVEKLLAVRDCLTVCFVSSGIRTWVHRNTELLNS